MLQETLILIPGDTEEAHLQKTNYEDIISPEKWSGK